MWRTGHSMVPAVPGRTREALRSGAGSGARGSAGLASALVRKQEREHKLLKTPHLPQAVQDGSGV